MDCSGLHSQATVLHPCMVRMNLVPNLVCVLPRLLEFARDCQHAHSCMCVAVEGAVRHRYLLDIRGTRVYSSCT
jgi:hypothetical protein